MNPQDPPFSANLSPQELTDLLVKGRNRYWRQLNADLLRRLNADFRRWPSPLRMESAQTYDEFNIKSLQLMDFIHYQSKQVGTELAELNRQFTEFNKRYAAADNDAAKQQLVLDFAKTLGAAGRQLRGDEQAFKRWFGHDAVRGRYRSHHWQLERYLSFLLQSLGQTAARILVEGGPTIGFERLWRRLDLDDLLASFQEYPGDKRVIGSAFESFARALRAMPSRLQHGNISEANRRFIYHSCFKGSQSIWLQCQALILLQSAAPESLNAVLRKRLQYPKNNEDLFVRRKVVQIIAEQLDREPELAELFAQVLDDPCPSVRQRLAELLPQMPEAVGARFYPKLLFTDACRQVRAAALLGLPSLLAKPKSFAPALAYLQQSLGGEQDHFVLRVALQVCREGLDGLQDERRADHKQCYLDGLLPILKYLHEQAEHLAVRRYAAQSKEYLLLLGDANQRRQLENLRRFVETVPAGKTRRIPNKLLAADDQSLAQLLSVLAQDDFGFDIEKSFAGRFLTRGHSFGFRWWRFLHEIRHPSPDKRQAFDHTLGRLFWGQWRAPSAILAELAATKVPGEPLHLDSEDGWRGYLPLPDDVISALSLGTQATYFYHSEGVTRLQPPANPIRRFLAWWRLTWRFSAYARLRNWREHSQSPAESYARALAELGIVLSFSGHDADNPAYRSCDPAVSRFFPALPAGFIGERPLDSLWSDFQDYFVSVYENSLQELALFMAAVIGFFMARNIYLYRKIRAARKRLPLVVGGWGTRGKSGTERLKAALINALGYGVVSKTTGCEALFLHAYPFGKLHEVPLFRPYDKASIWEQHDLVCLADKLHCEAFLWECMGLTPAYVDILQRQWMNDDIATLTNTYPDHEDIQGPAGVDIPQAMTHFIPQNGLLLTSEEQMRPILKEAAARKNAYFRAVGWLQAGLLAEDILVRFPYDEHPYNIALVLALAEELGIDRDFAVKEMADRVVPDIGVLKTYPAAPWRSRRLEFINGMSANERFGCLGNWRRCGLDRLPIEQHPAVWLAIVVNNRADRIARSQVFAGIIVSDLTFDRCVLIGNNLTGLVSYIKEAWREWLPGIGLKNAQETPQAVLLQIARRFRVPYAPELVGERLKTMLAAQVRESDLAGLLALQEQPDALARRLAELKIDHHHAIAQCFRQDLVLLDSYQNFVLQLDKAQGDIDKALEQQFHELLWFWFEQKLLIVEDYHATGNQVITAIGHATPPGFYCKIMGMQNIKGTGLDFVYRWQAFEKCFTACRQLLSANPAESLQGLRSLAAFQEHGVLTEETVAATLKQIKSAAIAQNEFYQAELGIIQANMELFSQQNGRQTDGAGRKQAWLTRLNEALEAFLDAGDAVKRRQKANQIYRDLVAERISHDRAALELQALTKRQKGGWLNIT